MTPDIKYVRISDCSVGKISNIKPNKDNNFLNFDLLLVVNSLNSSISVYPDYAIVEPVLWKEITWQEFSEQYTLAIGKITTSVTYCDYDGKILPK